MKTEDFYKILDKTPTYVPIFKLIRVPEWVEVHGFVVGDLFYFDKARDSFIDVKRNGSFGIGPSAFKFVEYKKI